MRNELLRPLAALLMLTGCGGGSSGADTPVSTPTPTSTATPTPTPTPTPTQTFPYTPVAALTASVGSSLPLGQCLNLGNHMEAPNEEIGRAECRERGVQDV